MKNKTKLIFAFILLVTALSAGSLIAFAGDGNVRYTALLVGNTYPETSEHLNAPITDTLKMKAVIESLDVPYRNNERLANATRASVLNAIRKKCSDASYDDDDLLLFYYSGHGVNSNDYDDKYNGALVCCKTYEGESSSARCLTLRDLADALDRFPGKVLVIMDSCGSGAAMMPSDPEEPEDPAEVSSRFLSSVINVFQEKDHNSDAADAIHVKNQELATNKFYVLAGCEAGKTSAELTMPQPETFETSHFGMMTYYILRGMGYDYFESSRRDTDVFRADTDKNNQLSLKECFDYASPKVKEKTYNPLDKSYQQMVMYPDASDPRCNNTIFSDANIKDAVISLSKTDYTYEGQPCTPEPVVKVNYIKLQAGRDFDVSYADNAKAGTASLTVTGKNGYVGSKTVSFKIREAEPEQQDRPITISHTVKGLKYKVKGKKAKISWEKETTFLKKNPQILGYQIQIAADKGFTKIKKAANLGRKKTSFTLKGKKNSVWYVRIRYYDGSGRSAWSRTMKVRI